MNEKVDEVDENEFVDKKEEKDGGSIFQKNDLLSYLESIIELMKSGINEHQIREDFLNVVTELNELNIINKEQMINLIIKYII